MLVSYKITSVDRPQLALGYWAIEPIVYIIIGDMLVIESNVGKLTSYKITSVHNYDIDCDSCNSFQV